MQSRPRTTRTSTGGPRWKYSRATDRKNKLSYWSLLCRLYSPSPFVVYLPVLPLNYFSVFPFLPSQYLRSPSYLPPLPTSISTLCVPFIVFPFILRVLLSDYVAVLCLSYRWSTCVTSPPTLPLTLPLVGDQPHFAGLLPFPSPSSPTDLHSRCWLHHPLLPPGRRASGCSPPPAPCFPRLPGCRTRHPRVPYRRLSLPGCYAAVPAPLWAPCCRLFSPPAPKQT